MNVQDLIERLKKLPAHAIVGAYDAETGEVRDVTGLLISPGETGRDHYIQPSVVLQTEEL